MLWRQPAAARAPRSPARTAARRRPQARARYRVRRIIVLAALLLVLLSGVSLAGALSQRRDLSWVWHWIPIWLASFVASIALAWAIVRYATGEL